MEKNAKQKKEQPPWANPSGGFVTGKYHTSSKIVRVFIQRAVWISAN
jgi:hypothetical protein